MELTFTDTGFRDVGVLEPYDGDFAWGNSENDFSIDVAGDNVPEVGSMIYAEGSDLGGIVTGYKSDVGAEAFSIVGHTWTGVLNRHVIGPDYGQAYLTLTGDVTECVAQLIARAGMGDLFVVNPSQVGVRVTHTFTGSQSATQQDTGRYMGCWAAVWQLLLETGCKTRFAWSDKLKRVVIDVTKRKDYTDNESQMVGVAMVGITTQRVTNHLICLGKGELANREIVHLYADIQGNVSKSQTIYGINEIAETYNQSSAETAELIKNGTKHLKDLWKKSQQVTIKSNSTAQPFDLGDVIGGVDARSHVTAQAVVTKKVASFKQGQMTYTYTSTVRE